MTETPTPSAPAPEKPRRKGGHKSGLPRGARAGTRESAGNPDWEAFEPTQEQREMVLALTGYGIPQSDIAVLITNPATGQGISEVTLRKYFPNEIKKGLATANSRVVGAMFKNATTPTPTYPGGNPTCQIFWAKARLGWRGESGDPDTPPPPPTAIEQTKREVARRIAFLLALGAREKKPKKLLA